PTADLRIIPKAGHWPHFETPDASRRHISAFLGLPVVGSALLEPGDEELARIDEAAQFLAHSDVGNNLNQAQRSRLAAQFRGRTLAPGEHLVHIREAGNELYIVQEGTVEVWQDPEKPVDEATNLRRVATYTPGQLTGELAMLDGGVRSADLRAGPEGARILSLSRDRLQALAEDDSALGSRLLWNIATTMALRVRFILWQMRRAEQQRSGAGQRPDDAPLQSGSSNPDD
ncbi:MAG: cyclic nucleotide-binding domain-containing protein, partial [Anaerolineales bacterium]